MRPPRPLLQSDDRGGFDCGRESLNLWFRRHAWRNQEAGVSRTSVLCDSDDGAVVAYVSLSAAQIERAHLPKSGQRNSPDPVPMILLGQLAVALEHQGKGYARSLVQFTLTTAVRLSKDIGCFGVMTHPLDDEIRAFYKALGFEMLPFDPRKGMVVRIRDLVHNGF